MANGQVPYTKESGVATFCDVNGWKSFGLNKPFSEASSKPLPAPGPGSVPYTLSDHQMGKNTGPLATPAKSDQINEV